MNANERLGRKLKDIGEDALNMAKSLESAVVKVRQLLEKGHAPSDCGAADLTTRLVELLAQMRVVEQLQEQIAE